MKRPAFQFYPADWRKDPALSVCSLAARGLWIELMCVMHESDEYGVLSINGKPMTAAQIARTVGETPATAMALLKELEDAGVFSKNEAGCIFSRRMVKDEHVRNVRAEAGSKGGNPNLVGAKVKQIPKQNTSDGSNLVKQTDKQSPTPSSSSSTSVNLPIAHATTDSTGVAPTTGGDACARLRQAGMADCNPQHPRLLALLAAGVTADEIAEAGREAIGKGKGFAWTLGTVEGRRRDAAAAGAIPAAPASSRRKTVGEMPPQPPKAEATPERLAALSGFAKSFGRVNTGQLAPGLTDQNCQQGPKSGDGEAITDESIGG